MEMTSQQTRQIKMQEKYSPPKNYKKTVIYQNSASPRKRAETVQMFDVTNSKYQSKNKNMLGYQDNIFLKQIQQEKSLTQKKKSNKVNTMEHKNKIDATSKNININEIAQQFLSKHPIQTRKNIANQIPSSLLTHAKTIKAKTENQKTDLKNSYCESNPSFPQTTLPNAICFKNQIKNYNNTLINPKKIQLKKVPNDKLEVLQNTININNSNLSQPKNKRSLSLQQQFSKNLENELQQQQNGKGSSPATKLFKITKPKTKFPENSSYYQQSNTLPQIEQIFHKNNTFDLQSKVCSQISQFREEGGSAQDQIQNMFQQQYVKIIKNNNMIRRSKIVYKVQNQDNINTLKFQQQEKNNFNSNQANQECNISSEKIVENKEKKSKNQIFLQQQNDNIIQNNNSHDGRNNSKLPQQYHSIFKQIIDQSCHQKFQLNDIRDKFELIKLKKYRSHSLHQQNQQNQQIMYFSTEKQEEFMSEEDTIKTENQQQQYQQQKNHLQCVKEDPIFLEDQSIGNLDSNYPRTADTSEFGSDSHLQNCNSIKNGGSNAQNKNNLIQNFSSVLVSQKQKQQCITDNSPTTLIRESQFQSYFKLIAQDSKGENAFKTNGKQNPALNLQSSNNNKRNKQNKGRYDEIQNSESDIDQSQFQFSVKENLNTSLNLIEEPSVCSEY